MSLATDSAVAFAVTKSGEVWAWGDGSGSDYEMLSPGCGKKVCPTPFQLTSIPPTTELAPDAFGGNNAYAVSTGGTVWAWGQNNVGELGDGAPDTSSDSGLVQVSNLTGVTPVAQNQITYAYDGTGLLASRTTATGTQPFTWDEAQGTPLILSDGTNSYIYGPGEVPIEQISSSGQVDYLAQDALGSTRLLTDSSGSVVGTTSYSPYGQVTTQSGTVTTPLGYAGQYTDSATGLIYMRARWYDPGTGQFLTVDPLALVTQQPYAYVSDNPLNAVDPLGLCGPQCSLQAIGLMHLGTSYQCPPRGFTGWEENFLASTLLNFATAGGFMVMQDPGGEAVPEPAPQYAYHYTQRESLDNIMNEGLYKGSFATPNGELSPEEAQSQLALPNHGGLPNAVLRIDLARLRAAGYEIPSVGTVGGKYGQNGGGLEMHFPYAIPPQYLEVVSP